MPQATHPGIPRIGMKTMAVGKMEERAMRKLMNILAVALVMLAAVGCEKNETLLPDNSPKVVTLTATINNGRTKTSLGALESSGYPTLWSDGDAIAVIQNNEIYKFNLTSGAGTSAGTFTLDGTETYSTSFSSAGEIKAFYPYEGVTLDADGTTVKYNVPAEQSYAAGSFGNGAAPMTAYREANATENLEFTNLFGAIKFQLKGATGEKLQSVEITSDKAVSGEISVTIGDATVATNPDTPNGEQKKVVLRKGTSDIVLSEDANNPTVIYIPVPAESHTFSVCIITDKGAYYKKVSSAQTITCNNILKMPVLNTADMTPAYIENGVCYGGGIELPKSSDGQETLIWAPVNCGYEKADGDYKGYPYGKLYQWGRKYGQGYSTYYDATAAEVVSGPVSLEVGQNPENKNKFYKITSSSYDWLSSQDNTLWNSSTEDVPVKTVYDPCPAGWRVPTNAELVSLVNGLTAGEVETVQTTGQWTDNSEDSNHSGLKGFWFYGNTTENTGSKVFFPAAGSLIHYTGSAVNREYVGEYWSSSVHNSNAWIISFSSNGKVSLSSPGREYGQSVRCVKE